MSASNTSVRAWSQTYGVDQRKARRMRRKAARTGEIPCSTKGCMLVRRYDPETGTFGRAHVVHFGIGGANVLTNYRVGPFLPDETDSKDF